MNKKFKYTSLVAAGAVTLGLVGGTLAWFTAEHSVTNTFTTGTTDNPSNTDAGIEVVEDFDQEKATNLTPGTKYNKDVQVKSTASYDQFIRVAKLKVEFPEGSDLEWSQDDTNITLQYTPHLSDTITEGNWVDGGDGFYYYIGKVGAGSHTNTLLDSVTLTDAAGNEYKNATFTIDIDAYSVQASNDAVLEEWFKNVSDFVKDDENSDATPTVLQSLKAKYAQLQASTVNGGLVDDLEGNNNNNDDHTHQSQQ